MNFMVPELNIQDLTVPEPNCQDGGFGTYLVSLQLYACGRRHEIQISVE